MGGDTGMKQFSVTAISGFSDIGETTVVNR